MEEFQYGSTSRGAQTLIYKSHEYVTHRVTSENVIHWRCRKYQSSKCRAIIHTKENQIVKEPQDHTHDIMPFAPIASQAVGEMKRLMNNIGATPRLVMSQTIENLSDGVKLCLPKKTSLARTLRRAKKEDNNIPIPTDRYFEIPEKYKPYVLYDSGVEDTNRIIIFGKEELLTLLENSVSWLGDGTFKVIPEIFFQLYSIHVQIESQAWPCVLALLPGKSQEIYAKMLDAIKNLIPRASPLNILTDFESAAMNAFRIVFPTANIKGCFFHLSQSILRKISDLGLKAKYENQIDHSFAVKIKMLCLLSLISIDEVLDGYLEITDQFPEEDGIKEFLNYFEITYIRGRALRNGHRRNALFPPEVWNQRDSVVDGIARTTNSVEGWHFALQSLFQCSHPTMWKFLNGLTKEIELQHAFYLQYTTGKRIPAKKRYRDLKEQLERMVEDYDNTRRPVFLRAVSHMF